MIVCPKCGTENPERARFCLECASPLAPPPAKSRGVRKLVTVVFADAVGSTALGERTDPETMRGVLSRSFAVAREVLERHGGTVEKFIGDAVMAVFGIPVLHEDDALRAVRAAVELRDRLTALDREIEAERGLRIRFRIGVNTGEVVAGGAEASTSSLVTGDAVNIAARLEQAAPPAEILIGELTHRLVQDRITAEPIEPIEAKGKAEPLPAFRLLSVEPAEAETGYRRLSARMVGRQRELARLEEAFEDAAAQRRCHLFTLLGGAGVGKSRLSAEFLTRIGERATVVRGRCLPYGEGITYWPIGEIVRTAAGFQDSDDTDAARHRIDALLAGEPEAERIATLLASVIGLSIEAAPREEVFWAVRRLLERLAAGRPVVCVIDDIHWGEATLLDLIEHVADWSRDAPILLVSSARPELLEDRPTWAGGKLNATTLLLEPLSPDLTRELVLDLLDSRDLPETITMRILDTAEGNPLFAEEIVRMLVDEGLLRPSNGGWVADDRLNAIPMPTSVQAVIGARLDRLPPPERTVAERAAVVGRVFERAAVMELVPDELRDEVPARLLALVRKELVRPDRSDMSADQAFRFRHLLIRDTAYEAIPKEERAELHERFAGWVERVAGERITEFGEIVGYHYEQAQRYRTELGLVDERTRELAERAGRHLTEAGRRAYLHGDPEAAAKLQLRGLPLVPPGTERRDALFMLAFAAQEVARWGEAREAVAQLLREPSVVGDEVFDLKARLLDHMIRLWTDPTWSAEEALALAAAAIPVFEARDDHQGLAIAYRAESDVHLGAERWAECRRASERALTHAIAIGERPLEDESRVMIVAAALFGPTPLDEVVSVAAEQIAAISSRLPRAQALRHLALANAWLGDADTARAQVREARRIRAEVEGDARAIVFTAGWVEQVLGDLAAAEEELRRTADILETLGETGLRATIVGSLAHVLFELQRPDEEVLAQVELTRQLAAADDAEAQSSWRVTKALVEARVGNVDEAERLAGEAIDIRSRTDAIVGQANLRVDRAWIRERAGRLDEARRDLEEALALYEEKGALVEIPRVKERLAALTPRRVSPNRRRPARGR